MADNDSARPSDAGDPGTAFVTRVKPPQPPDAPRKLGLALSGGGFRTALFHIGTLLRMAQLGVLKHVEVISSVSGGSIVGAVFYVRLLDLMEHLDGPPGDEDLVELVEQIARTFPAGVSKNVRVRTLTSYRRMVQMAQPDYSRSDRVAELYDRFFFSGTLPGAKEPITMMELGRRLESIGMGSPADGRMPELRINATSLASGRVWRFSGKRMGEAAFVGQAADIDRVTRFAAPASYGDLLPHPAGVPLSIAVAASSALPGGLHPMSLSEMYAHDGKEIRIQLTDGGVHDNQGLSSLLQEDCTDFIVSDTGGQMSDELHARTSFLSVLLRTQQILYGRVRQLQLMRASAQRLRGQLSPLALIHLRRGTKVVRIWPSGPGRDSTQDIDEEGGASTSFGIAPEVMELLADLRTDLDSFSEVESKALMSAGYLVAGAVLGDDAWAGKSVFTEEGTPETGSVLGLDEIRPYLERPSSEFLRQLKVGKKRFFKVPGLYPILGWIVRGLGLLLLLALLWGLSKAWDASVLFGYLVLASAALFLIVWIPTTTWGARWLDTPGSTAFFWIRNVLLAPIPWIWFNTYLVLMEPWFQRGGSVRRLKSKGSPGG